MRTKKYIDPALQALNEQLNLNMDWSIEENEGTFQHSFVTIKMGNNTLHLPVEVKAGIRHIHLSKLQELKNQNPDFLLVTETIAKPLRKKLRDLNINFIDKQGNAFIHAGDVHIAADGLQGRQAPEMLKTFRASGLKLIWFLLQKPEYLNQTYRQIAAASGVSLDTISKTLRALEKQNFYITVRKNERKLVNKKALLERWLIGFEDTLKPKLNIGRFRFADKQVGENWDAIQFDPHNILWGGEPAAAKLTGYLVPEVFSIYTNLTAEKLLRNYRMIPDSEGNVEVNQLFFNSGEFDYKDIVPPLLIYADLQISGEERNMETANIIYEEYLAGIIQ